MDLTAEKAGGGVSKGHCFQSAALVCGRSVTLTQHLVHNDVGQRV